MIHHNGSDGGISISGGSSTRIRNNTIAENYWYGIYSLGVDPNIYSNIVWGNNAGSLVGDTFTKIHFNCIQNYTGGGLHNITSDPCFGNPDTSNYHLKYGSPCINKGDPNFSSSTETDIDGEPRIMASEHNGTARVDMGADEFYRHPADFLPYDGVVNFLDFNVLAESWMISEGQPGYDDICDLNNDGTIDYKDLEIFCESWLWVADWRLDN